MIDNVGEISNANEPDGAAVFRQICILKKYCNSTKIHNVVVGQHVCSLYRRRQQYIVVDNCYNIIL